MCIVVRFVQGYLELEGRLQQDVVEFALNLLLDTANSSIRCWLVNEILLIFLMVLSLGRLKEDLLVVDDRGWVNSLWTHNLHRCQCVAVGGSIATQSQVSTVVSVLFPFHPVGSNCLRKSGPRGCRDLQQIEASFLFLQYPSLCPANSVATDSLDNDQDGDEERNPRKDP